MEDEKIDLGSIMKKYIDLPLFHLNQYDYETDSYNSQYLKSCIEQGMKEVVKELVNKLMDNIKINNYSLYAEISKGSVYEIINKIDFKINKGDE